MSEERKRALDAMISAVEGNATPDAGSEPPHTSPTGSEEDPNIDRFFWKDGDLKVIYDPYAEERRKRGQRP